MRVLVTGGAGFIGSHIVHALIERGDTVRVLDNFSSGKRQHLAGLDIELVEGDILDASAVRAAALGMTHVIHLAAFVSVPGSVEDPLACDAVNVTGTLNVLLAARELGIQRVVFASSTAVYGDAFDRPKHEDLPLYPLSPYGVAKLAAEKYCQAFHGVYGLETVALRFFNVFGPRQDPKSAYAAAIPRFIRALLENRRPVIYGDGEQTRDFVYVTDVAQANLLALQAPGAAGQAFNIASGESVSINHVVRALGEAAGTPLEPEHIAARAGEIRRSEADITKARAVLGFTPAVNLCDGLALTLRWHRELSDARV
jgi:UDP-glucose 4-epimerase